jgi:hypothetical protein
MTPPISNESPFEEEEELRTAVSVAIDRALDDVLESGERRQITNTEEEKLTYFAIRDQDLPLTYSWYLAGANTVAGPNPENNSLWRPARTIGELHVQEVAADERVRELRGYFRSQEFFAGKSLRDLWFTDKFEFLREFYESEAPQEYRELYLHSLELRRQLNELDDIIESESQHATLGDFGGGGTDALLDRSTENKIRYLVSDFHVDLAAHETLTDTKKLVVEGTDLIERLLSKLTHLKSTTSEQRQLIDEVHDFFYYYVWKYPALFVSAETASGPNADSLQQKRIFEFDRFETELAREIDRTSERLRDRDLLPRVDERITDDSDKASYFHSVLRDAVDNQ